MCVCVRARVQASVPQNLTLTFLNPPPPLPWRGDHGSSRDSQSSVISTSAAAAGSAFATRQALTLLNEGCDHVLHFFGK